MKRITDFPEADLQIWLRAVSGRARLAEHSASDSTKMEIKWNNDVHLGVEFVLYLFLELSYCHFGWWDV